MYRKSQALVGDTYFLQPGYIYVPSRPSVISTVLGSCVSVCIFDKKRNIGGMNHFQLPLAESRQKATPRYGNVATYALIKIMLDDGSKLKHLEAQIFGGAFNPDISPTDIGKQNVMIARRVLMRHRIPVVSEDVGGKRGRKIVFNTGTNEVAVLKVERLRKGDWFPYDRNR